ncbi:hypothetical protein [Ensifer sp. OV372]|uniref:hypothetical protein n=1 Tax=Ensifer sp. OV372 TaxID=1855293 RepID=UPI0008E5EB60|nr:hypothetical protein [Ensifer sp. OV372]SFG82090.1 hypothetical protein SAMN05216459_11061 [Ensifer sp. OV372]
MKLLVVGVSFFLSFSTLAEAGGAPPPRMPSPEGQQPQSQPETTVRPAGEPEIFAMPSGNIGCIYTPAGGTSVYQPADGGPELACDIVAPRYVRATLWPGGSRHAQSRRRRSQLLFDWDCARLWAKLVATAVLLRVGTHWPFLPP